MVPLQAPVTSGTQCSGDFLAACSSNKSTLMRPLDRDHVVIGPYTLRGARLTFRTGGALLAQDAGAGGEVQERSHGVLPGPDASRK